MARNPLIPAAEKRLAAFIEVTRNAARQSGAAARHKRYSITVSREFGCEAYPMTEVLKGLLDAHTGEPWTILDRALLDEVARDEDLSARLIANLGEMPRVFDAIISTLAPDWRDEEERFQLLAKHIVAAAKAGNAILVGRGSPILTQGLPYCFHVRIVAPFSFKVASIARRLGVGLEEAEAIVTRKQALRDRFIADFLQSDPRDLTYYHLVLNNGKNTADEMAHTIFDYMLSRGLPGLDARRG